MKRQLGQNRQKRKALSKCVGPLKNPSEQPRAARSRSDAQSSIGRLCDCVPLPARALSSILEYSQSLPSAQAFSLRLRMHTKHRQAARCPRIVTQRATAPAPRSLHAACAAPPRLAPPGLPQCSSYRQTIPGCPLSSAACRSSRTARQQCLRRKAYTRRILSICECGPRSDQGSEQQMPKE